jgi:hypothetical protein
MANLRYQLDAGKITKRQYKGWKNKWKNIFNIVPEEDFGLFMMDFGLRMMAASGAGEALGTSMGMAGQGALAGVQERQRYDEGQTMEMEKMAGNEAWRQTQLSMTPPQTLETAEGIGQWNPNTQGYDPVPSLTDPSKPALPYSSYNRPYSKEVLANQLRASGVYSEADIARVQAGDLTTEGARAMAVKAWNSALGSEEWALIGVARASDWRGMPQAQKDQLRERFINDQVALMRGSGGGGALTQELTPEEAEELRRLEAQYGEQR